ncbi:AAA+ family ATPase [groundwater metagenome]
MAIYKNNLEHLLEELHRIDTIIRLYFEKSKAEHIESPQGFQGLYISEDEINAILQTSAFELNAYTRSAQEHERIEKITREINRKKVESIELGKELRLHILSELFHMQPFEVDALLICLVSELDMRYEKLYSYLQNDVTRKRPSVDLVIKLLCYSMEEKVRARDIFSQDAPLIKNRLVYLIGDEQVPLLSKFLKVDDRIINFLLGDNAIDQRIRNISSIIKPQKTFQDLILPEDTIITFKNLINHQSNIKIPMFFFYGPYGSGKKMAAEAICNELGMSMLFVNSKALMKDQILETIKPILREALLQNSSMYFEGFDGLLKGENMGVNGMLMELDQFPNSIFLSGEQYWEPAGVLKNHSFISLAFPVASLMFRKRLWESLLDGNASDDLDISALASKFKFSGGQIKDAISTARNILLAKKPGTSKLLMEVLNMGCKAQSNRNLSVFARKIEPHYTWDDIVLPEDIEKQLKEISCYIKYRGIVYTDWGFDKKFSIGKGLNALFTGPSGTGKTMSAEIIARDAGLDLYKIDLSNVVSKYIGETEKNLSNIFKEAETSNAILFFDEADALFGKRSEVKDAHDRYANIEIGYLLQKMDEYEGIVILATNLSKNIDDAFLRRMQFVIEFPFPDEKQRKLIWTGIFPKGAPRENDIDYNFFGERLNLAGGNIKNIALSSAFYAAEESCEIGMHHIMRAAKREYLKIGKPFLKEEFEPYYKMIEEEEK